MWLNLGTNILNIIHAKKKPEMKRAAVKWRCDLLKKINYVPRYDCVYLHTIMYTYVRIWIYICARFLLSDFPLFFLILFFNRFSNFYLYFIFTFFSFHSILLNNIFYFYYYIFPFSNWFFWIRFFVCSSAKMISLYNFLQIIRINIEIQISGHNIFKTCKNIPQCFFSCFCLKIFWLEKLLIY